MSSSMTQSTPLMSRSSPTDLTAFLKDKLGILIRGWWAIAASVGVFLLLAVGYLVFTKPLYEASARVLILERGARPLNVTKGRGEDRVYENSEDFIPTQLGILLSQRVVGRAIEAVGLDNLPTLRAAAGNGEKPVLAAIDRYLAVTRPDRRAMILKISYRSWSQAEAEKMAQAVVDSYGNFLEEHYQHNNSRVVSLISKARDELSAELGELEKKHLELVRQNPILTAEGSGRLLISKRMERWDNAINEATVKSIQLQSQLKAARDLDRRGTSLVSVAYALNQLGGDNGSGVLAVASSVGQGSASDYVRMLSQQEQQLAERRGPQYSKVREIHDQITRVLERSRDSRHKIEQVEVKDLLDSIQQSLEALEETKAEYAKRRDEGLADARQFAAAQATELHIRSNMDRQRELFHTVVDHLKQAQLSGDFSSVSAHVIELVNSTSRPVSPRMTRTLGVALLVGVILGVTAVLAVDTWDARVRSLEDIRRVLDLGILGRIPLIPKDSVDTAGGAELVSHALPRSMPAESYKQLRTNFEFLRRKHDARVVLVTSPVSGEGKSVTASNLAISVALAGRKVLLVDADLRRPSPRMAGVERARWGWPPS